MEFLKSLVPAVISGDGGVTGLGAATEVLPRDTGPRLLRMKRLGLLTMGHTIEEDQEGLAQSTRLSRLYRHRQKGTDGNKQVVEREREREQQPPPQQHGECRGREQEEAAIATGQGLMGNSGPPANQFHLGTPPQSTITVIDP